MNARTALAAAVLLASALAPFAAQASGPYAVAVELSHQGEVFAAPSVVVRDAEPASMEVTGATGYKLALTVRELAADRIEVVAAVDSAHGSISPTVVVKPGVPASMKIGEMGLTVTVAPKGG